MDEPATTEVYKDLQQGVDIIYEEEQAPEPWTVREPIYDKDLPSPGDLDAELGRIRVTSSMVPSPLMRLKSPSSDASSRRNEYARNEDGRNEDGRISPLPMLDSTIKSGRKASFSTALDSDSEDQSSSPVMQKLFASPLSSADMADVESNISINEFEDSELESEAMNESTKMVPIQGLGNNNSHDNLDDKGLTDKIDSHGYQKINALKSEKNDSDSHYDASIENNIYDDSNRVASAVNELERENKNYHSIPLDDDSNTTGTASIVNAYNQDYQTTNLSANNDTEALRPIYTHQKLNAGKGSLNTEVQINGTRSIHNLTPDQENIKVTLLENKLGPKSFEEIDKKFEVNNTAIDGGLKPYAKQGIKSSENNLSTTTESEYDFNENEAEAVNLTTHDTLSSGLEAASPNLVHFHNDPPVNGPINEKLIASSTLNNLSGKDTSNCQIKKHVAFVDDILIDSKPAKIDNVTAILPSIPAPDDLENKNDSTRNSFADVIRSKYEGHEGKVESESELIKTDTDALPNNNDGIKVNSEKIKSSANSVKERINLIETSITAEMKSNDLGFSSKTMKDLIDPDLSSYTSVIKADPIQQKSTYKSHNQSDLRPILTGAAIVGGLAAASIISSGAETGHAGGIGVLSQNFIESDRESIESEITDGRQYSEDEALTKSKRETIENYGLAIKQNKYKDQKSTEVSSENHVKNIKKSKFRSTDTESDLDSTNESEDEISGEISNDSAVLEPSNEDSVSQASPIASLCSIEIAEATSLLDTIISSEIPELSKHFKSLGIDAETAIEILSSNPYLRKNSEADAEDATVVNDLVEDSVNFLMFNSDELMKVKSREEALHQLSSLHNYDETVLKEVTADQSIFDTDSDKISPLKAKTRNADDLLRQLAELIQELNGEIIVLTNENNEQRRKINELQSKRQ